MKLVVLPQAEDSLRLSLRILSAFYSKRYLLGLERLIRQRLRWLAKNPGAGQFEPELEWANLGHRRLVVRHFKIVYRIDGDTIVVNDIFDARRDPKEMKR